jgi:hypothetical protein
MVGCGGGFFFSFLFFPSLLLLRRLYYGTFFLYTKQEQLMYDQCGESHEHKVNRRQLNLLPTMMHSPGTPL